LIVYRVFPYDAAAALDAPGGALYVPPGGANRIDNPDLYRVLYVAERPEAAIAETFGRLPIWRAASFVHANGNPYALATFEAPNLALCDLDDVAVLQEIGVRHPSHVVRRDRAETQSIARHVYEQQRYAGLRWWCYYSPEWGVMGLWEYSRVRLTEPPRILTVKSEPVQGAAAEIVRQVVE
jgi:hypothetical protein